MKNPCSGIVHTAIQVTLVAVQVDRSRGNTPLMSTAEAKVIEHLLYVPSTRLRCPDDDEIDQPVCHAIAPGVRG